MSCHHNPSSCAFLGKRQCFPTGDLELSAHCGGLSICQKIMDLRGTPWERSHTDCSMAGFLSLIVWGLKMKYSPVTSLKDLITKGKTKLLAAGTFWNYPPPRPQLYYTTYWHPFFAFSSFPWFNEQTPFCSGKGKAHCTIYPYNCCIRRSRDS